MRERYALDGVPLIIDFVERGSRATADRLVPGQRGRPGSGERGRSRRAPAAGEDDRQAL